MATDIFDQLAEWDVPPPPVQFNQQLHERVNRSLLVAHVADLFFGCIPWALGHFARAVVGMVIFTFTGRYETRPKSRRR